MGGRGGERWHGGLAGTSRQLGSPSAFRGSGCGVTRPDFRPDGIASGFRVNNLSCL